MDTASYIEQQIDSFIIQFNTRSSNYERLVVANNIIEAKLLCENEFQKGDLFRWTRQFIKLSIMSDSETASNHFTLSTDTILERIIKLPVPDQIGLLKYSIRELRSNGYMDEADWFEQELRKVELRDLLSKFKIGLSIEIIVRSATYNNFCTFISLILIYLIYSLILFPWTSSPIILFEITYVKYSNLNWLNHLGNTAMAFLELDSEFKVVPVNTFGVIMMASIKIILLLFIYNFLINHLSKNLER